MKIKVLVDGTQYIWVGQSDGWCILVDSRGEISFHSHKLIMVVDTEILNKL